LSSTRRVLANFGFFLQITGLFLILPIAIGLQNGELQALGGLIATCFLSFAAGFLLNSFCERKDLDDRTSLWLMLATFVVLPAVLMIPFIWSNVFNSGNPFDLITNAYFETVSGFTTTGFTFVSNPQTLPISILFYRSLVEFIGGIGFIYIIAAFLYPGDSLDEYAESFGIDRLNPNLRKVFISVVLIYTVFVAIFTVVYYYVYNSNLIVASCTAIDVLTGGYQPNLTQGIGLFQISALVLMLLGSLNFKFHYDLFRLKLRNLLTPEIRLYLILILASTIVVSILAWANPFDSLFNVVSMSSSTGIETFSMSTTTIPAKVFLILVGLAGGCTFSMAGGIRMERIQKIVNAIRRKGDQPDQEELRSILVAITGFLASLIVLSLMFMPIGISFLDSVFEVGSALTTNGISMGATVITMPIGYKWLMTFAMIIGRVEIVSIIAAIAGLPILAGAKRVAIGLVGILRKAIRR
jgi:trk/ktr system potassium uptake protein